MAARKKTRAGSQRRKMGRPAGPAEKVRRNRVVVFVTDSELAQLHRMADKKDLPLGTVLYQIIARALGRGK